jgi:hypothetical protein
MLRVLRWKSLTALMASRLGLPDLGSLTQLATTTLTALDPHMELALQSRQEHSRLDLWPPLRADTSLLRSSAHEKTTHRL